MGCDAMNDDHDGRNGEYDDGDGDGESNDI